MNQRLIEMQTAKAWGKTPSEWNALSADDRAEMMALEEVEGIMAGIESQEQRDAAKTRGSRR